MSQSYQGDERRAKARPFTAPAADAHRVLEATASLAEEAAKRPTAYLLAVFDLQGSLTVDTCGLEAVHAQSILEAMPLFAEDLRAIAGPVQADTPPPLQTKAAQPPTSSMLSDGEIESLRAAFKQCRISLKI